MKDVVNEALRTYLGPDGDGDSAGRNLPKRVGLERIGRFDLPVLRSRRPARSAVTPAMLKEAEAEEDQQRDGSVFGR